MENGNISKRKIRLITNCERPSNYLMRIAIKQWLKTFDPSEIIFLVNNLTGADMLKDLKENFNIEAKKVNSIEEAASESGCLVWEYVNCNDYNLYHSLDKDLVNSLQKKLLQNGTDVVIFLDRDEVLYHKDLRTILNTFEEPLIRPRGIEIIQTGDEKGLDEAIPLHVQRSHVRYFPSKSKPCITRIPVEWSIGRHLTECGTYPHGDIAGPDAEYPGLYLIHLDKIDKDLLYELRVESSNIFKNNGYHVGVLDEKEYLLWFTEAYRNNELYRDSTFLKEVGI